MDANGVVVMPGKGPVWSMEPGRSSTVKLRNGETDESVMMFEEVAPVGTVTSTHLHHDSDEIAYVLSGEITFKIADAVTVGGPGTSAFCHAKCRMPGRAPALTLDVCCSCTPQAEPESCSRRWRNGRWIR